MSNSTQALGLIGAIVGAYFTAGTSLAAYGGMIGAAVGSAIGASMEPDTYAHGPRMDDRRVQVSTYGAAIPYLFGTTRVAGNVIWAADLEEVATENEQGGKGGGPSFTSTTYTYFGTFAVLLGYGPQRGVRRVWADSKLIFDGTATAAPPPDFGMRFYQGTEDQLPDPTMEAVLGVGNVPAYRGFGYIVFSRVPLEKFGNRLPSITVELTAEGEWESTKNDIGTASPLSFAAAVQRLDGYLVGVSEPAAGTTRLSIIDPATGLVTTTADHAIDLNWSQVFLYTGSMFYVPPINEVWLAQGTGSFERYSAETLANLGTVTLNLPWNEAVGAYEPSQRRVVAHRASSQVGSTTISLIKLDGNEESTISYPYGGEEVINFGSEGIFYGGHVVTGGSAVFLVCAGHFEFGVFSVGAGKGYTPLLGAHPTPGSSNAGAWDALHQRYVVAGKSGTNGAIWTVTDSNPPVITQYMPEGMPSYGARQVQYLAGLDVVVTWDSIVGIVIMTVLDASTFEVLLVDESLGTSGITQAFPSTDDPGRVFVQGNYQPYDVQIFSTTVGAAVRRLALESRLDSADIDVTELSMRLRGLIVSQAGPAVGAIEQLARVFQFEGVEEDDQLYFRRRGGATVATIASDECAAGIDKATDNAIVVTRMQEIELPRRLSVSAPDPVTDHQPGTQYAERRAIQSGQEEALSTAVVLTATESKRLADALIFDRWAGRERLTWATHCRYIALSPSDPIVLDGQRVRILNRTHDGGMIKWEGVSDDADVVVQVSSGVQGSFPGQLPSVQVPTLMSILDMALLADAQDDAGAYVAAWGVAPYWRGAVIYSSADGGVGWTRVTTMPRPGSAVGTTTTALGDWTGGNVFDETNSVNVSLSNGEMSSDTRAGVLAGNNSIAIDGSEGWEVLQYREAVLEANGSYTLRGLLRGRRGTGFATGGHAAGNRAVLLSTTKLRDLPITNSQIGMSLLYKAVSIGDTLSSTASTSATINAERLKPWSPVDFRAMRDVATGDITMTWKRRTRLACRFVGTGGINVPLGEASEAYVVRILDPGSPSTIVRTINVTGPATAAYSAAEQVTDFGSLQSTVHVRITQTSAIVGAGHELEAEA